GNPASSAGGLHGLAFASPSRRRRPLIEVSQGLRPGGCWPRRSDPGSRSLPAARHGDEPDPGAGSEYFVPGAPGRPPGRAAAAGGMGLGTDTVRGRLDRPGGGRGGALLLTSKRPFKVFWDFTALVSQGTTDGTAATS